MTSILLAAKHTPDGRCKVGGVQTWIATVRTELKLRGFECFTWANGDPMPARRFDYGIIAHLMHTEQLLPLCNKNLVVSHGVVGVERVPSGSYISAYTSEEVAASCGVEGPILRQPIDLNYWSPGESHKYHLLPNTLVHYGYRSSVSCHESACQILGMNHLHLRRADKGKIRDILRRAACVMATGRAACEAMACGAPVVICDNRCTYQKELLDPDAVEGAMTRNYSGRGGGPPSAKSLVSAVLAAMDRGGLRQHAEKHHDVKKIVDQILNLLG